MFHKVLIANRGEIAVRIIRACREMGIATVAVFSEPDRDALHTQLADEAVCIGPAKGIDSYLNMENIISAAVAKKAQAIHPGFGFLAENSIFATMCRECNIQFIGPSPEVINKMGNKANAREMMKKANVPVVPGSDGTVDTVEKAVEMAEKLGYPVMIKAAAGGGGKGIRIANGPKELETNYNIVKQEAKISFNDDEGDWPNLFKAIGKVAVGVAVIAVGATIATTVGAVASVGAAIMTGVKVAATVAIVSSGVRAVKKTIQAIAKKEPTKKVVEQAMTGAVNGFSDGFLGGAISSGIGLASSTYKKDVNGIKIGETEKSNYGNNAFDILLLSNQCNDTKHFSNSWFLREQLNLREQVF